MLFFVQYLEGLVEQKTDNYLDEFQAILSNRLLKDVSIPTLWRELDKMDISNKKVS